MGYIYKIYNDVNDKVYIGQTTKDIEHRFGQHKKAALNGICSSKLYRAMHDIGVDKFHVEALIECDDTLLDSLERQAINQFDSFNNGYNSTTGGSGYKGEYLPAYLDELIEDYLNGESQIDLCCKYRITRNNLVRLTSSVDRPKQCRSSKSILPEESIILMFDSYFNYIKHFNTIWEAYNYAAKDKDRATFRREVSIACFVGNMSYGYRWQRLDMLRYNGVIFRSIFDIEDYKNNIGTFIINNGFMESSAISAEFKNTYNKCQICGKKIDRNAKICEMCHRDKLSREVQFTGIPKPSKEELEVLVQNNSLMAIGRMYGVHGNSVKKWCIKLGIDYRK